MAPARPPKAAPPPPASRSPWALASVAAAGLALASPTTAEAYDRQVGISVGAGYTVIAADTMLPPHAVHASAGLGVGLGDTWELRARADYSHHFSQMSRLSGSVDLVYLLDVLSVVPYLGLGVGGAAAVIEPIGGTAAWRGDLLLGAVLGFDVLLGREWTVGVEIRPTLVPTDLDAEPLLLTALVRGQLLLEI